MPNRPVLRLIPYIASLALASACGPSVQLSDTGLPIDTVSGDQSSTNGPLALPTASQPSGNSPTASPTPTGTASPVPTAMPAPPPPVPTMAPPLSGACVSTLAQVVPNLLLFEKRLPNTVSSSQAVSVFNRGSESIRLLSVQVTGPFKVLSSVLPALIPAPINGQESKADLSVQFQPVSQGNFEGSLTLTFDGAPSLTIDLVGSALASIPTQEITTCQTLNSAGTTYNLKPGVNPTSSGTCFTISATNITLDLGGNIVTFASGGSGSGVSIPTSSGNGAVVRNGTLLQSASASSGANGVQIGTARNVELASLDITVASQDSKNIYVGVGSHHYFHDNVLVSQVTRISDRHSLQGALLKFESDSGVRNRIQGNRLEGGPQGGISIKGSGSQVYNNRIKQKPADESYANNFSIWVRNAGIQVFQNRIGQSAFDDDPEYFERITAPSRTYGGRGIMVRNDDSIVFGNVIDVIDQPKSVEYGGCQGGGTYGIQIDASDNAFVNGGVLIYGNDVTATAKECDAYAFRMSGSGGSGNRICGNTFHADKIGTGNSRAYAQSGGPSSAGSIVLQENRFRGASAYINIPYQGSAPLDWVKNTFETPLPGTTPYFFWVENKVGTTFSDLYFLQSTFQSGVDFSRVQWGPGDGEYLICPDLIRMNCTRFAK